MNIAMKVGSMLEADMSKLMVPKNLKTVLQKNSKIGINGGDISTSLLEV